MNWDQVKKILALVVAYFKDVFKFFKIIPEDVA